MKITITNYHLEMPTPRLLLGSFVALLMLIGFSGAEATAQDALLNYLATSSDQNLSRMTRPVGQSIRHNGRAVPVIRASAVETVGDLNAPIGSVSYTHLTLPTIYSV